MLRELHHMSRFGMESRGGQGRILQILAQDGDMTQRVFTEKLGIQPGSVSEVIGKLERAGYVSRTESAMAKGSITCPKSDLFLAAPGIIRQLLTFPDISSRSGRPDTRERRRVGGSIDCFRRLH